MIKGWHKVTTELLSVYLIGNTLRFLASPLSSMSPASQPTKLVKPMRTLLEEINNCQVKPLLEKEESEEVIIGSIHISNSPN